MINSGIPRLDNFLGGGIPEGKSLMYLIQPEVEGEIFGMQSLYHNLKNGKKAVLITTRSDPEIVKENFKEYGWDLSKYMDNFAIVDAYSSLMGCKSSAPYVIEEPSDIVSYDDIIEEILEESGTTVTLGSLSSILDLCGEEAASHIKKWNELFAEHESVGIYNFTNWPYSEETKKMLHEAINAIVKVGGVGERVVMGQYYGVIKVDWREKTKGNLMFKIDRPGGIKAFIPKLLVTGPFNAGKSTFVRALSTQSVSVDRMGTTIALDHGHIEHEDISADIFGTPGQARFDPILNFIADKAMGIFLLVDSTKPNSFPRAKSMLEKTRAKGLPLIIVANKQDIQNALSVEEIKERMNLPQSTEVFPADALQGTGVIEAFKALVRKIEEEGEIGP